MVGPSNGATQGELPVTSVVGIGVRMTTLSGPDPGSRMQRRDGPACGGGCRIATEKIA